MSLTFKALSALLCYPSETLQAAIAEIRGLIAAEGQIAPAVLARDSLTSVSASPTSVKLGRPLARWTSTVTA